MGEWVNRWIDGKMVVRVLVCSGVRIDVCAMIRQVVVITSEASGADW